MTTALGRRALLAAGCVALVASGSGCASRPGLEVSDQSSTPATTSPGPSLNKPVPVRATCPEPSHGPAHNLVADAATKRHLLAAGAELNHLPTSDYTGLDPGMTYYAYIPSNHTYWAGARLAAKPTSLPAEVAGQDAGGYLLFWRRTGGPWHALLDGGPFKSNKTPCPIPPSLPNAWGWPPHARAPRPSPAPATAIQSP